MNRMVCPGCTLRRSAYPTTGIPSIAAVAPGSRVKDRKAAVRPQSVLRNSGKIGCSCSTLIRNLRVLSRIFWSGHRTLTTRPWHEVTIPTRSDPGRVTLEPLRIFSTGPPHSGYEFNSSIYHLSKEVRQATCFHVLTSSWPILLDGLFRGSSGFDSCGEGSFALPVSSAIAAPLTD